MISYRSSTLSVSNPQCLPARISAVSPRFSLQATSYKSPSSQSSASELEIVKRYSDIVVDSVLAGDHKKAATVSFGSLAGIVAAESLGLKPYQNAILTAMNYDRCRALPPTERAQCHLNKALVNVGAMFAQEVEGRVCTQVDVRAASSSAKMVAEVDQLSALYKEMGVAAEKLIFRLPATWAGIQAAKQLEAKGVATQVFLVYSLVQAVAAAQAGVSVIQPSVGRTREWFSMHPGVIRDPHGPRQDAGGMSATDPGLALVHQIYNYVKQYHPKTKVMASGIRTKDDVLALCGVDYLVVPNKVLQDLSASPTVVGYNDGLHALDTNEEGSTAALSMESAQNSGVSQMSCIDEKAFQEMLGLAGSELLKMGLKQQVDDAERILPYFAKTVTASASL